MSSNERLSELEARVSEIEAVAEKMDGKITLLVQVFQQINDQMKEIKQQIRIERPRVP